MCQFRLLALAKYWFRRYQNCKRCLVSIYKEEEESICLRVPSEICLHENSIRQDQTEGSTHYTTEISCFELFWVTFTVTIVFAVSQRCSVRSIEIVVYTCSAFSNWLLKLKLINFKPVYFYWRLNISWTCSLYVYTTISMVKSHFILWPETTVYLYRPSISHPPISDAFVSKEYFF